MIKENQGTSRTEIFSLERDIKLPPVITIVLYYGEEPWDGPNRFMKCWYRLRRKC